MMLSSIIFHNCFGAPVENKVTYSIKTKGCGSVAKKMSMVDVHYTGWLEDKNNPGHPDLKKNLIAAMIATNHSPLSLAQDKSLEVGIRVCKACRWVKYAALSFLQSMHTVKAAFLEQSPLMQHSSLMLSC